MAKRVASRSPDEFIQLGDAMNLARPLKPFRPALPLLLAFCCASPMLALDPDTVFLKVTQTQKLVDGRYQVTLQWNSLAGADYRVQGQEGLGSNGWIEFGIVRPSGTTGQWIGTVAASLVDQGRFFMRLVLPQEEIDSIEPAFVPAGGGVFYILGQCFAPTDRVFVNGVEATVVVFEDHTRLKVTMAAMAAGVYDVEVRASDGTTQHAKLADSLTVNATGTSDELPPSHPLVNDPGYGPTFGGGHDMFLFSVRPSTGELTCTGVDLAVPGRGPAFIWARTYRSKAGPSTAQGEGWDFSYNISATQSGGDVVVRDGEGRTDTFFNQGDGTWSRAEFFRQGTMSGQVFTLMFADKGTWRFRAFDAAIAPGKIDRITDRNGNHLDCAYDGAGRLQTITDTLGKNFTVAYNGAGKIQSVTDFTGRAVTYGYDAAGDLTSVTSPPVVGTPTGNDFPLGKTITFTYSSGFADARLNHNLLTVTSALGSVVLTCTYAATLVPTDFGFDRCLATVEDPGPPYPTEEVSFYYSMLNPTPANNFTTTLAIINNHGNVSEVRSDSQNRPLEIREYTGRSTVGVTVTDTLNRPTGQLRAGDPPFFTTTYDWNAHSCLSRLTLPRGGMIDWYYESDLTTTVNPRERGNLRVEVTTAAPAVPSDFTTVTRTWTHLPGFGTTELGPISGGSWAGPWGGGSYSDDECILLHVRLKQSDKSTPRDARMLVIDRENNLYAGGLSSVRPVDGSGFVWDGPLPVLPPNPPGDFGPIVIPYPPHPSTNVSNAAGMIDLFNSAAAKSGGALSAPQNAVLYGAYINGVKNTDGNCHFPDGVCAPEAKYTGAACEPRPCRSDECFLTDSCYQSGFPTESTDGNGFTTTFGYDPNGNTTTVIPPIAGTGHTFEYNGFGQPTAHIWPQNANGSTRRDEFTYHTTGSQTGWEDGVYVDSTGMMFSTRFEYNAVGAVVRVVDNLGRDTLFTRNSLNQPVRITSREASPGVRYETDIRYDANDNVTSVDVQNKDETGALVVANPYFTTQYQYDALDRPVRVIREVDAANTVTTERVYDPDNHTVTIRSPEAVAGAQPLNVVRVTYDERGLAYQVTHAPTAPGQSTTQHDYDLDGNLAALRYGMELVPHVWLLTWDGLPRAGGALVTAGEKALFDPIITGGTVFIANVGAQVPIKGGFDGDSSNTNANCIVRCVDVDGDGYGDGTAPRMITDPMGNTLTLTRDERGSLIAARLDGEHSDAPGNAGNVRLAETRYIYDALNRPVTCTGLLLDNTGAQIGSVSGGITWAPNSQPASVTDPRGNVTIFGYDTANRPSIVTDAKTNTRAVTRDANGNVLTVTATDKSDLGNPQQVFVVTRTFDGLDRPLTSADNVGNTAQYAYDSRSNLVLHTDARNIQTRYAYDGLSRPLNSARDMDNDGASAADPQDIVLSRTWDRNSRLATATNANGFVTTRSYDALDRLVGAQEADGTLSGVTYDAHHRVTQSTDANGSVIVYTYDALNRLTVKNITPGAGVLGTTTGETFEYDGISRLKTASTTGSAPTSTDYTYDSLSRPTSETQGALTVMRTFDAAGNVTAVTYPGGNVVTTTYDSLNRPLAVTDSVNGAIVTNSYIGPDRIERQNFGNGTVTTLQYDGVQGVPNAPGDLGWRQVFAKTVTGPGGSPTHDARQYFYNANQQRTGRINLVNNLAHQYTLDNAGRLVNTVMHQGGPPLRNTTYAYDKAGNRQNVSGTGTPNPGPYQMNPALPNPGDAQMNQYSLAPTGQFTYDENGNRQIHNTGSANLQHQYDYANRLVAINNLTTAQPVATYQYDALGRRVQKVRFPGGVPTPTNFLYSGGGVIEERDGGGTVQAILFEGIDVRPGCMTNWVFSGGAGFGPDLRPAWNPALVNRGGNLHTFHADPEGSIVCLTNASGAPAERYDYQDFGDPQFYSAAFSPLTGSVLGNPILFCSYRYDSETGFIHIPRIGQEVIVDFAMGLGAGKVNTQDISITSNPIDKSSAGLMQGAVVGRSSDRAVSNPSDVIGSKGYFDPKTGSSLAR